MGTHLEPVHGGLSDFPSVYASQASLVLGIWSAGGREMTEFGRFSVLPEMGVIESIIGFLPDRDLVTLRAVCRDFRRMLPNYHIEYRWTRLMSSPVPIVKQFNSHTREYEVVKSDDDMQSDPFQVCPMLDAMGNLGEGAAPLIPRVLGFCNVSSEFVRWSAVKALCKIVRATIEDAMRSACVLVTSTHNHRRHIEAAAPQIWACLSRCLRDESYLIRREALDQLTVLAQTEHEYETFKAKNFARDVGFHETCPLSFRQEKQVDKLVERVKELAIDDPRSDVRLAAKYWLDTVHQQRATNQLAD